MDFFIWEYLSELDGRYTQLWREHPQMLEAACMSRSAPMAPLAVQVLRVLRA